MVYGMPILHAYMYTYTCKRMTIVTHIHTYIHDCVWHAYITCIHTHAILPHDYRHTHTYIQVPSKQSMRFLRVTIASGWDDFVSVHRIGLEP